jgi:hypothetical protein
VTTYTRQQRRVTLSPRQRRPRPRVSRGHASLCPPHAYYDLFRIAVLGFVAALAVVAGALIVSMIVFEYPGGIPPSYRATDGDGRLTPIAREAIPIIQSIDRYYRAHGQCPRVGAIDLAELQKGMRQRGSSHRRRRNRFSDARGGCRLEVLFTRPTSQFLLAIAKAWLGSGLGLATRRRKDKLGFCSRRWKRAETDPTQRRGVIAWLWRGVAQGGLAKRNPPFCRDAAGYAFRLTRVTVFAHPRRRSNSSTAFNNTCAPAAHSS